MKNYNLLQKLLKTKTKNIYRTETK